MLHADIQANAISHKTGIEAFAKVGDMARSEHWLSTMLPAGVEANTISYNTLIKACAETHNVARAEYL